jgi:hypothetical protein
MAKKLSIIVVLVVETRRVTGHAMTPVLPLQICVIVDKMD